MATLVIMALHEESQGLFEASGITPLYSGVGQVKATHSLTHWIHKFNPTSVINVGTAGSHKLPQGTLVECTSFVQRQPNKDWPMKSKKIQINKKTELLNAVCGTGDFIELNQSLTDCDVMDMEAYALAFVCEQLKVPFCSIKYVSDSSNENVVTDWKKNLSHAAEKLLLEVKKIY